MITITISFDPSTGKLGLNGPIADKVTCLGVLDLARHALLSGKPAEERSRLAVASAIPDLARKPG